MRVWRATCSALLGSCPPGRLFRAERGVVAGTYADPKVSVRWRRDALPRSPRGTTLAHHLLACGPRGRRGDRFLGHAQARPGALAAASRTALPAREYAGVHASRRHVLRNV